MNEEQATVASPDVGGEMPQAQPQQQPELNINDLQNLRAVIDTACRRGAFGANEMSSVGVVFDRLNTFLNAVTPPVAPDAELEKTKEPV
jgi:hypothetical protein